MKSLSKLPASPSDPRQGPPCWAAWGGQAGFYGMLSADVPPKSPPLLGN